MGATGEQHDSWYRENSGAQREVLLSRVAHLESLLHTLKLRVFCIETAKELHPNSTACLQVQMEVLQEQCEVQLRSSQREASRLRDRLQREREAAMKETKSLQDQLHSSQCTQITSVITAEELKRVKVQMNQKLQQVKKELKQEGVARMEAEQSHNALLQALRETDTALEKQQEQVKALEAECDTLRTEVQDLKEDIQEKVEIIQVLQKECEKLRERSDDKDTLISKLTNELKNASLERQKKQQENKTTIKDRDELRAAADKIQGLYDECKTRCSDLSSALHSLTDENKHLQELLKIEKENVAQHLKDQDVQLDIAKEHMLNELQAALADRLLIKKELETLWRDHTLLQRSSSVALEAAVNHQNLLERTITKLREDLSHTVTERDTLQQENKEKEALRTKLTDKEQELHALRKKGEEEMKQFMELVTALQSSKHHRRKSAGEASQLKKTLDDALSRSHDLSRTNEKLRQRVQDLEVLAFNQGTRIKAQNILLKHRL